MDARIDFLCMQLKFFASMAPGERCSQNRLYGKKLPRPIWVSRNAPEWGIDVSNTAAVIMAIEFFFSWFDGS